MRNFWIMLKIWRNERSLRRLMAQQTMNVAHSDISYERNGLEYEYDDDGNEISCGVKDEPMENIDQYTWQTALAKARQYLAERFDNKAYLGDKHNLRLWAIEQVWERRAAETIPDEERGEWEDSFLKGESIEDVEAHNPFKKRINEFYKLCEIYGLKTGETRNG